MKTLIINHYLLKTLFVENINHYLLNFIQNKQTYSMIFLKDWVFDLLLFMTL